MTSEAAGINISEAGKCMLDAYLNLVSARDLDDCRTDVQLTLEQVWSDIRHETGATDQQVYDLLRSHRDTRPAPADREVIANLVYGAMIWAAGVAHQAPKGRIPAWIEDGNSDAQFTARQWAGDILNALSPAPVSGWRDMESAPKDGRAVLLWWPHWWHDPHPGYYLHNRWHSDKALSGGTDDDPNGPTHWMPLPAAPTSEPATEQDAVREAAWEEPTVVYNWNTASWEIRKRLHQRFTCRDDALRALIEREEG